MEFQQHVFATAPPAKKDFDVLNLDDIRSGSPSKPVVIRQCTNKLPGIVTPPAESLTSFCCVTEGIPREVKIIVCFSSIRENEDEFTLEEFLEHNEDCRIGPEYHPMNVIDFNADSKNGMVHRFCLPNTVTDNSFGHCMKTFMSPKNQLAFDFTPGKRKLTGIRTSRAHPFFTFWQRVRNTSLLWSQLRKIKRFLRNGLRAVPESK